MKIHYNGKELDREAYLKAKGAEIAKAYKGITITPKSLSELLSIAESGEELADNTPQQYIEILAGMNKDLKAEAPSRPPQEQHVEPEQDVETGTTPINPDNGDEEAAVFALALSDTVDVAKIDQKFTFKATHVLIAADATPGEIGNKMRRMMQAKECMAWAIGDLGNALVEGGYEDVISNICAQTNLAESTVYNHMSTCRVVPVSKRAKILYPSIAEAIMCAHISGDKVEDLKAKNKLLDEAIESGWTVAEARSHVKAAKEEKAPKPPEPKHFRYIVHYEGKDPVGQREEPAYEEGMKAYDLKTLQHLVAEERNGKTVIEWVGIDAVTKEK